MGSSKCKICCLFLYLRNVIRFMAFKNYFTYAKTLLGELKLLSLSIERLSNLMLFAQMQKSNLCIKNLLNIYSKARSSHRRNSIKIGAFFKNIYLKYI